MENHTKKITAFLELHKNEATFKRWAPRLNKLAHFTQEGYLYRFAAMIARFNYTPQGLYEARLKEVTSNDPLEWGIVRDQATLFMHELVNGDTDEWPDPVFTWFKVNEKGDLKKPLAPGSAKIIAKALTHFFETFGERMELKIKTKDLPQGDSQGAKIITPEELALAVAHPGGHEPFTNVALTMFLKDSGMRRSDIGLLDVGDYLEARKHPVFNDYNEPFMRFDPKRTQKERILAHIHLGPEAIEDIDNYLEIERSGAAPDEALFIHGHRGGEIHRMNGQAAGERVKRMIAKGLGAHRSKGKSAHSIRKLHKTGLEAGGMPDKWILYIQGKSRGVYSLPEGLQGTNGENELMEAYMKAYDKIRIRQGDTKTLAQTRTKINALEVNQEALIKQNTELKATLEGIQGDLEMAQAVQILSQDEIFRNDMEAMVKEAAARLLEKKKAQDQPLAPGS
jgi:hypothetical protein